jgi:hypothetical protein
LSVAVIPAKAGIQHLRMSWIPACAGMTIAWVLDVAIASLLRLSRRLTDLPRGLYEAT